MGFRVKVRKNGVTTTIPIRGKSAGFDTAADVKREFARQKRKSKALKGIKIVSVVKIKAKKKSKSKRRKSNSRRRTRRRKRRR